jgi:hypothetical protein
VLTSWKFTCSEQAVPPLEMSLLTSFGRHISEQNVLEINTMAVIHQGAVKNAICDLRSKVV